MTDDRKEKKHPAAGTPAVKKRMRESGEFCEICGQRMQRDPESGEDFCPDCYDLEDKP